MKAIYVKIGNKVYRVKQNTAIPTSLTFRAPGISSSLNVDSYNKTITQNIFINNLKKPGTKSNGELYTELVDYLKTNQVTEIKEIQNFFKIYVDYSAFEDGKEIEHSAVVRPLQPLDKLVPLGVASNNECVYRRVKTFSPKIEFRLRNALPHGIIQTAKRNYTLKIHNIAIFQDFSYQPEVHESTYDVAYSIGSSTIQASLDNMKMIYSTENAGIEVQEISVGFMPRNIFLDFDIVLADYIVVYDDAVINRILIENIEAKYPQTPDDPVIPENPEVPDIMIPDEDSHPDADGDYNPDENGYFAYYERCRETTPNCLLVVEDLIPDGYYDLTSMIRVSKVKKDIDDIEVGEYVIYRESMTCLV